MLNTLGFLNSNMILMHFVILNFQTLRIFIAFLQSKGSYVFKASSSSQNSQDECAVYDFVKPEGERMRLLLVLRILQILKKNMAMVISTRETINVSTIAFIHYSS